MTHKDETELRERIADITLGRLSVTDEEELMKLIHEREREARIDELYDANVDRNDPKTFKERIAFLQATKPEKGTE